MASVHRTREQKRYKPAGTWRWWNHAGSETVGNSCDVGDYLKMSDSVTPQFWKRIEKGDVIMNPMQKFRVTRQARQLSDLHCYFNNMPTAWTRQTGITHNDIDFSQTMPVSPPNWYELVPEKDVQRLVTEVSTRCLSQASRASTDMWENLAERRKTAQMLMHPLGTWFRFERQNRVATSVLSTANAWLAYRYGLRPLIGSTIDVLNALTRSNRPTRVTTRAKDKIQGTNVSTVTKTSGSDKRTYQIQKLEEHQVKAISIDEVVWDMSDDLGFDKKSLLQLPWNMIPYSFVVDWFVNVGDFIGALGHSLLPTSLGQCLVHTISKGEERESLDHWSTNTMNIVVLQKTMVWGRVDYERKSRTPGLPAPGLVIKKDFRLDDLTRISDALGLVAQQIASRFLKAQKLNPKAKRKS